MTPETGSFDCVVIVSGAFISTDFEEWALIPIPNQPQARASWRSGNCGLLLRLVHFHWMGLELHLSPSMIRGTLSVAMRRSIKVETPIHDNIRELVTWECKEDGVKS